MRSSLRSFFLLFTAAAVEAVSQNVTHNALELAKISSCGMNCLLPAIQQVNCSLTDFDCICGRENLPNIVASCSLKKCSLYDSFTLVKVNAAICEPKPASRGPLLKRVDIGTQVIARTLALLRLAGRLWLQHKWLPDDWAIAIVFVIEISLIFRVKLVNSGFGSHTWMLEYNDIKQILRWMYASECVYVAINANIKIAILLSFLNVFPDRRFRIFVWIWIAFCGLSAIAFFFATVFQCTPIAYSWDKSIVGGHCINFNAAVWIQSAINIVHESVILVMPIYQLWGLQMSWLRKIGLICLFSMGGFILIVSIIRAYYLRNFGLTADPSWDNAEVVLWAVLETSVGACCACIPALRAPCMRLLSFIFPSLNEDSTRQSDRPSGMKTPSTPEKRKRFKHPLSVFDTNVEATVDEREMGSLKKKSSDQRLLIHPVSMIGTSFIDKAARRDSF